MLTNGMSTLIGESVLAVGMLTDPSKLMVTG